MKPEIIIMLTHHDVTVKDAGEIFEQCKDLPVKFWGFKNVGLPKDEMKKVAGAMKAAGKTTFLEVVTYDEASCLDGAQTAIDCGFDYLMGTVYYDSVAKLLKDKRHGISAVCRQGLRQPEYPRGHERGDHSERKGSYGQGHQGL